MSALALALCLVAVPPPGAATTTLTGEIREVRAGPGGQSHAVLWRGADIPPLSLRTEAPLAPGELSRLAGAEVALIGRSPPGDTWTVYDYRILRVGHGRRRRAPEVGILAALTESTGTTLLFVRKDGRAGRLPAGWSRKLSAMQGAKVWFIGRWDKDRFRPERFAILAPARKDARHESP